jgi:2-dehydro-3-deoxy-L-rhamnonate dehydrogenase (NAD+)
MIRNRNTDFGWPFILRGSLRSHLRMKVTARVQFPAGVVMNIIDLKNRTAIVTGGARGIGFAIAKRMLASGATVVLWDVDAAALDKAGAALHGQANGNGRVHAAVVDVTTDAVVARAVATDLRERGKIDILVNNAGITGGNAPLWELAPEVWRRVVEVNLVAPYLTCRAVVPHMMRAGYGRIVNIASIAGKEGNPNASHYSASKAGLIALTKSLAKELAATGVLVNCVTPAAAKTELFAQMKQEHIDYMLSKIPMNRFVEVDEIAGLVAWLASEDCSFSTGAVFDISGGRAVY